VSIAVATFAELEAMLFKNMWTECQSVQVFEIFSTSRFFAYDNNFSNGLDKVRVLFSLGGKYNLHLKYFYKQNQIMEKSQKTTLTFWRRNYFFLILAHTV